MMNIHHLELFYYVAKHGGISQAVRHMPYGIQQPAVSSQVLQLEQELTVKLFVRTPFKLTSAGELLYAHVRPFFDNLSAVADRLRAESEPELRVGGAEVVLRDHVSLVMRSVRARHPRMRLRLHSGFQSQVEEWLRNGLINLAITSIGPKAPAQLHQLRMVRIPLVLLVHRSSPLRNAAELWKRKKITEPLVGQPKDTSMMQGFQRDLRKRGIVWPQTVESTSVELVARYVANGEGYGVVNIATPGIYKHRDVRVLPLEGFEPMTMGALWSGELSPLVREVIGELRSYAQTTFPDWACSDQLT